MTDPRGRVIRRGVRGEVGDDEILRHCDATTIEVRLAEGHPAFATQCVAAALVDLLCRVFPRIAVSCDPQAVRHDSLPGTSNRLAEHLNTVRSHGVAPLAAQAASLVIQVGPGADPADLYVDGDGWQAYLGREPSRLPVTDRDERVPFGPLTAACRATAHAFVAVMHPFVAASSPPQSVYWSALDYRWGIDPLQVEHVVGTSTLDAVLAGAGSVGGAAAYAWRRTRAIDGHVHAVDPQNFEDHNFDRALLVTRAVAEAGGDKPDLIANTLADHSSLTCTPHTMDMRGFVAGRPRAQPLPLVLCPVDSPEQRREVQDCLPLEVINASVSPERAVVSGHRTGDGPCVMCLYAAGMLHRESVRYRVISRITGWPELRVIEYVAGAKPLSPFDLRDFERVQRLPTHALDDYQGRTLDELYDERLLYGGVQIKTSTGGELVVAAPWVTALAGFLLAAESFKAGHPALQTRRLGPRRSPAGNHYQESPYASPELLTVLTRERFPGSYEDPHGRMVTEFCLCASPRRRRLTMERYGLTADDYPL